MATRPVLVRRAILVAVLAALCALAFAAQSTGLSLAGRVVDSQGEPLPAHVVVGCQSEIPFDPYEMLLATKAGDDGRFAIELPRRWIERSAGYRKLDVFAYLEGFGIATRHWSVAEVPAGFDVEFRLPHAAVGRVRFVDSEGRPVVGARVWPQGLAQPEGGEFRMPSVWWRQHAATTDADGWATLPVAVEDLERIGLEADGFGLQNFGRDWQSKGPLPSELEVIRPLVREVHIDGPVPARAALVVDAYSVHELDSGAKYVAHLEFRTDLAGAPPFTVLAPPVPTNVRLVTVDDSALAFGRAVAGDDTKSPASGALRLPRTATYRVHGRAVDAESGRPVTGARIRVQSIHQGWVESGADGRFELLCAAEGFSLTTLVAPEGFASVDFLDGYSGRKLEAGGDVDLEDVRVSPSWTAKGLVVGPERTPVVGAWVVGQQQVSRGRLTSDVTLSAVTDAAGRYEMRGALSGIALAVSARLGDRTGTANQGPDALLELLLSPALRARGTTRDPTGAPIAGVELELWRASPPKLTGGEELVALGGSRSFRTGADGAFESAGGLDADETYCFLWSGESVESGRSDWFSGAQLSAGIELAVGTLATVRGAIRAVDGTPIAGAEVRLRRGKLAVKTNENGEFALSGLAAGGDVLIALDSDGAPHVRWVSPDSSRVDWQLQAQDSPESPWARAPDHERVREVELAFELLDADYSEAVESGDEGRVLRAVRGLAWADPATVLERVEAGLFKTEWMRNFALAYVADALLQQSPEESLAVSNRQERGMSRALSVLEAAQRLGAAAEREQLALVRAEARAIDPPEHRIVVLAHLADRLLDLGEVEAAEGVLTEGRLVAAALPPEEWPGYARSRFGEVLSRIDAVAGRELIDGMSSVEDRGRHLFNTAHELAASDPAAAQELVDEQAAERGDWSVDRFISRITYRMAPADLARARELALRHDPTGFADGMIALALADSNPAEARKSLEQAFQRVERFAQGARRSSARPIASAAALLPVAERIDPDGLRGYVARAVALRGPPARGTFGGEDVVWREDATLAFYLTCWEPDFARSLLAPAVEAARRLRGDELRYEYDAVWAAAAVIDPEWAAQLGRELGGRARSKVGLVLALPPGYRTTYVQDEIVGLWIVGKEDL